MATDAICDARLSSHRRPPPARLAPIRSSTPATLFHLTTNGNYISHDGWLVSASPPAALP